MVKTKGVERSVSNWKSGAAGATGRYTEGVKGVTDWQEKAQKGDSLYKQRIQEAIAKDSRSKGIAKVSNSEWQNKAAGKGSQRWAPGVSAAEPEYRKGIGAVLGVIESVTLPDRVSDPAQNVQARVTPIAVALRKAKDDGVL